MLTGWPEERFVPSTSAAAIVPEVAMEPWAMVKPTAIVPSWQLRQSFEEPADGIWEPELYVLLV
jgi:hypothetical protein